MGLQYSTRNEVQHTPPCAFSIKRGLLLYGSTWVCNIPRKTRLNTHCRVLSVFNEVYYCTVPHGFASIVQCPIVQCPILRVQSFSVQKSVTRTYSEVGAWRRELGTRWLVPTVSPSAVTTETAYVPWSFAFRATTLDH